MTDDRKTLDEMMLAVVFKVDALDAKFDALKDAVEKRAPMPAEMVSDTRSLKRAAWVIACGIVALVLHSVVADDEPESTSNAVETAARYGGP